MWASKSFIDQCFNLQKIGLLLPIEVGSRVARGFADVGFEEYCVLPGRKLVSLLNGKVTPFPEEEQRFFFLVPTTDQITIEIDKLGIDILHIDFVDRREWVVHWREVGNRERSSKGVDLDQVLLSVLSEAYRLSSAKGSLNVING